MKETLKAASSTSNAEQLPAPKGIGMAVAFDWGLTVELFLIPLFMVFLGASIMPKQASIAPNFTLIFIFVFAWAIAALFAIFGEGLRRGWRWTRPIQIVGNALGFIGGLALLVQLFNNIKVGNYWSLVPTFILLIISPIIAWRLSRPETATWFKSVTSQEARQRHGGSWVWWIALWSIIGGTLVALGAFH
ncbi:MAG TPA: hypothetical protein VEI53_10600 [Ktedonobacteraceae bacterium]|nr:hypothetical protein [Ktedonobacteraceae bacterium]